MKILLSFWLICVSLSLFAQDKNTAADESKIKQVIQTAYVDGLQNEGDTVKINSGFHPSFEMLMPMKDGVLKKYALHDWKEKIKADVKEGKLPRKADGKITIKFLNVDISGTVAVAKFEFYVGEKLTFIDYLSLMKFDQGWKIVSKMYYRL
jgi:flagella basal body P-ring formation protein FlgA